MATDRRGFLGAMMAAGVIPALDAKVPPSVVPSFRPSTSSWDVSWADKITGKHRAVFDSVEISAALGLIRPLFWLKDYAEEYWAHHKIGEATKINAPATKAPITRNPALGANPFGLPAEVADDSLRKALATSTILACNVAFSLQVVPKVMADMKLDQAKAREMALKHVVPGIILQPSGVFATLRAQEAGCQYLLATDA